MNIFKQKFNNDKSIFIFAFIVVAFSILFILIESVNNKLEMNDFYVYFSATKDFFNGNNPYQHSYGIDSGYFKYAPPTLLLFSPSLVGKFWFIKYLHLIITITALITSFQFWKKIISNQFPYNKKIETKFLLISFLAITLHVSREFHLGNINLVLLSLFSFGMYYFQKNVLISYILLSFMFLLKPSLILVILPILLYKEWKKGYIFLISGFCFFIIPAIFFGWNLNLKLWTDWLKAITIHGDYIKSPQSLQYLFNTYFEIAVSWIPSILFLLIIMTIHIHDSWKDKFSHPLSIYFWSAIFLAFGQNFFITDTEHFLLGLPLIMLLLNWLYKLKNKTYWGIFMIGMLLFSFDSMDLLGRKLSTFVYDYGLLGIGNLIFITLGIILWKKEKYINMI